MASKPGRAGDLDVGGLLRVLVGTVAEYPPGGGVRRRSCCLPFAGSMRRGHSTAAEWPHEPTPSQNRCPALEGRPLQPALLGQIDSFALQIGRRRRLAIPQGPSSPQPCESIASHQPCCQRPQLAEPGCSAPSKSNTTGPAVRWSPNWYELTVPPWKAQFLNCNELRSTSSSGRRGRGLIGARSHETRPETLYWLPPACMMLPWI